MRNSQVENERGILLCDGQSKEDGLSDRESRVKAEGAREQKGRKRESERGREERREQRVCLPGRKSGDEIVCMRHSAQPDQFSCRYLNMRPPTREILQGFISASYKLGLVFSFSYLGVNPSARYLLVPLGVPTRTLFNNCHLLKDPPESLFNYLYVSP